MKNFGKRTVSTLLAILLCLSMMTGIVLPASAAEEPVCDSKITGVSVKAENLTEYNSAYNSNCLLDGNMDNFWHGAAGKNTAYITLDLGADMDVSRIVSYARNNNFTRNIKDYKIWVSDTAPVYGADGQAPSGLDAVATTEGVAAASSAATPYAAIMLPGGTHGRYLTLYYKVYDSNYITICEMEFYGRAHTEDQSVQRIEEVSLYAENATEYSTTTYLSDNLLDNNHGNEGIWHGKKGVLDAYVTFIMPKDTALSEMVVYARASNPQRNIKNYEVWVSDTAPSYSGTDGEVPTGLAETPTATGVMNECTALKPYGIIKLPQTTEGRYVTIHIDDMYDMTYSFCISGIEFYGSMEKTQEGQMADSKMNGVSVVAENAKEYGDPNPPYVASMLVDGIISQDSSMWHGYKGVTSAYITFDLGGAKTLSKMLVYARTTNLNRNIKNYQLWVSDTAPVYSGVDGETPTGLAATPTATGIMNECTEAMPYGTIELPAGAKGRYVTLYIQDLYDMGYSFCIREIEFFESLPAVQAAAAQTTALQIDYENGALILPSYDGITAKILSVGTGAIALDGTVNTVVGGTSEVVLQFTDEAGNTATTEPISVFVIGLRHRLASRVQAETITASSELVDSPATYMLVGESTNKWWSSEKNVKENEILLTLQEASRVAGVSLKIGKDPASFPDGIEILTSSDNKTWDSVYKTSDPAVPAITQYSDFYFEIKEGVKYIKLLCTNAQEYTQIGKIRALVAPAPETAAAAAEKLTAEQEDKSVVFDDITEQFAATITESSNESIVAKNGTVTLPDEATDVTLSIKVTNRLDTADTATVTRTLRVKTQAMLDVEAVAKETDLIPWADGTATKITLPAVPEGYSIKIVESTHPEIVDLDGNITRSDTETVGVRLTFEIKNEATGAVANTNALLIPIYKTYVAPTMTQAEIDKIHQDYESMSYGAFIHYVSDYVGDVHDPTSASTATMYRDGAAVLTVNELADAFDVKQFAKDMHDFGTEYVILTAWHADARPLYPSMVNQRWRDDRRSEDSTTPQSYADRDVIDELITELDQYGIDLHLYTAFHHARSTLEDAELIGTINGVLGSDTAKEYYYEQYYELVERYGDRLDGIWIDGVLKGVAAGEEQEWFKNMCRSFNPAMILSINTGFNAGDANLLSHYNFHDVSAWEVNQWVSYREFPISRHQTASCLASQYWWVTRPQASTYNRQPVSEMFQYIVGLSSVSYEGGFAASTGIYAIEPEEHGKENDLWLNGMRDYLVSLNEDYIKPVEESVKNTSVGVAYPTTENISINEMEWGVSTESRDGKNVYLHVFNAPESNTLSLPAPADGSILDQSAVVMNFDGTTTAVTVTKTESGYDITLPEGKAWDAVDTVIKLTRTGYDAAIPTYTGDKVFYDQAVEGLADGTVVVREIDGKEYYLTVGTNVSGTLTDDCYPVVDGVTQVHFLAKEYEPFHIYFGSYALYGAKAGISPNDPEDITKANALRADDEGETVMAELVNYSPSGTTYIASEGKVTFDGFTFKGNAKLQIGKDSDEDALHKDISVDIINCRNSTAEDAYALAPASHLFYGGSAEHKIVNFKNNRFDGVCFNGTSATAPIVMRNWEGVVENNFISMKNSVAIGNNASVDLIFYMPGESKSGTAWPAEVDVTIRNNHLEGRVTTTVQPMWCENYRAHIVNNTIVPTAQGKSLINIVAAGNITVDGKKVYYSNIDTADILISDNKIKNLYNVTGIGFSYFSGTVTADAAEQVADINHYKAGNIKITHNEFDYGTVTAGVFGGSATSIKDYANLVIDVTCNKYGETITTPVNASMAAHYAALNVTDETAHKEVITVEDTAPTVTAEGVGHKECTFCGETVEESVVLPATGEAKIGEQTFATLEEALSAAEAGQTVTLNKDASVDFITVDPKVTLDLGGHVLTAGYVIGFATSAVIDSSKENSGKLIVDKDKVALDKTNGGYLPVYEENGYIFTTVKLAGRSKFVSATQFAFSPVFETFSHEALVKGFENSNVNIIIRLTWEDEGNYRAVQDFTYLDERVARVIGSYDASEANYGLAFAASFEGSEAGKAQNVQVTAVVVSDTGVEIAGSSITMPEV